MKPQHQILVAAVSAGTSSMWSEEGVEQKLARAEEELARNQAGLRGYSWLEHLEIYYKRRMKSQQYYSVVIGPDGERLRTLSNPAAPSNDGKQVKEEVVSRKVQALKNYMAHAYQLIDQYTPPAPGVMQASFSSGDGTIGETSTGMVEITLRNCVRNGDVVTLTFDVPGWTLQSIVANSYLGKDPVDLKVTFASLPDGTRHAASAFLVSKQKDIEVDSTSLNYQRR